MPQQRRKTPFSGKKKKDQLMQKRQVKVTQRFTNGSQDDSDVAGVSDHKLMEQPLTRGRNKNVNRYNLQFFHESKKELEVIKKEGFKALEVVTPKDREIGASYFENYDFPVRPFWTYDMDKETLDRNENRYFREYVDQLQKTHREESKELSLFELNLETWRQLWRVLEYSDILLIIVDVRYATLMFPPSLYDHIVNKLKKHAILVLNKVDLVAPEVVVAWRAYFKTTYPDLPIVLFSSYPTKSLRGTRRGRQAHKRSMEGVHNIYRECQKIVKSEVDLTSWEQKILEDMRVENFAIEDDDTVTESSVVTTNDTDDTTPHSHIKFLDGILTVGCIGFPNVGKSSLINALKGRKVVSVSRTPGHTKHFQTIFLTNVVRLCDSPGLVFPSSTPKYLQVLLGSFPISQLQVPYRSLKFLAEHLNLKELLKLQLPEDYDEWTAVAVSDAWALKRGFLTAKAARPDRYRAANNILRMCLAGQQEIVLQFYPPNFDEQKDKWLKRIDEIAEVNKYQNAEVGIKPIMEDTSSVNSDSDDSDGNSSSNDETNADEEDANAAALLKRELAAGTRARNAFALLEDE